jgi:putative pyruvate formate lyase activating enzyme
MWRISRPDSIRVLNNPNVKTALPRYVDIVKGKKFPNYLIAQSIPVDYSRNAEAGELWKIHDQNLETFKYQQEKTKKKLKKADSSFLNLKTLIAHRIMQNCKFCERDCKADRLHGDRGFCRAGRNFSMHSAFPHMGEEPELVPSGTIFTGGCSIRCIHCQNWDISQWHSDGVSLSPEMMAMQVNELAEMGCRNINLVGGDPTPYVWHWLDTMNHVQKLIATVWNSNSYYSLETAKLLSGFIDLYLLDFKYGNNRCASEISDAPGYWEAAIRNHLWANKYGELIIRVLVLPGHNECCTRPILQWIHDNLGAMTRVNLMFQYRPEWRAMERPELRKRLSHDEVSMAKKISEEIGLRNLVK